MGQCVSGQLAKSDTLPIFRCLQKLNWTGNTDLAVQLGKLCMPIREGCDLCWAHECEIQGVEEQHHVLALQSDWVGQEQIASATAKWWGAADVPCIVTRR